MCGYEMSNNTGQHFFYKSHVSEMKLAISYQLLCAEHKYDIQIAKLALFFCNYNVKEINFTT